MRQINIHEAKTQLSRLVELANQGEEIIIAKAGKPMARLAPLARPLPVRKPGILKGKVWFGDNFDEPMSEEELALWYSAPIEPKEEPSKK
jgi:prevent-host-death family protein